MGISQENVATVHFEDADFVVVFRHTYKREGGGRGGGGLIGRVMVIEG